MKSVIKNVKTTTKRGYLSPIYIFSVSLFLFSITFEAKFLKKQSFRFIFAISVNLQTIFDLWSDLVKIY